MISRLNDTELGVLTGIAFAFFYAVMGIPIARWADRGNRVTIIGLTVAVWSVMVFLSGMAGSFPQLLLIRVGVAVGEAGCNPTAQSLIADHFTREERPRAMGIYLLGGPLSLVIGYFVAGWLNQFYGWRIMFMVLGAPGIFFAMLAWFTLKEPRLGLRSVGTSGLAPEPQPSLWHACVMLFKIPTFRHLLFCFSVISFFGNGIAQWLPAYFERGYHLGSGVLGTWFGAIFGVSGATGLYLGGEFATRYAPNNERLQMRVMALVFVCFGLVYACMYLSTNYLLAFTLMSIATVGGSATNGPIFATIQSLVPNRLRATAFALIYLFTNLIGLGLGPLAAGALSDLFHPWAGEESLRYALIVLCPGYLGASWYAWAASKTVARDLDAVHAQDRDTAADAAAEQKFLNVLP